jgi:hypothetical protein
LAPILPAIPLQNRHDGHHSPNLPSILGRRERSSSPCSTPRNRQRLTKRGAAAEGEDGAKTRSDAVSDSDYDSVNEQGETTTSHRDRGRGHGTSTGRGPIANQPKDSNRGATAPPAWIFDPRRALDEDLCEEDFHHQSRNIDELGAQQIVIPYIRPEPENQLLSSPGYHFVLDLALVCRKFSFDAPGEENPIAQIFELLKTAGTLELDRNDAAARLRSDMAVDSLENIANRCSMAEQNSTVMDFVFMINTIQLRCKVIRLFS